MTLKSVKIEPPPPDPDPDIFLPSTQGDPPPVPRAQVVIQTDQDADAVVPLDWALKPSSLSGGDQFRLLFLTNTGHSPRSTDIDDYNTYVQGQANASNAHSAIKPYSSGFRVVGSTDDNDARDNTSKPPTPTTTSASPSTGSTATRSPTTTRTSTTAPGTANPLGIAGDTASRERAMSLPAATTTGRPRAARRSATPMSRLAASGSRAIP